MGNIASGINSTSSLQVFFGRAFESLALSSLTWGNVPCLKRRILVVFDFCQGVIELGWDIDTVS